MDEQEKELEEILRMFDKAPSPSSERNNKTQSSKGRDLSPKRKTAIKRRKRQRAVIVSLLALLIVILIVVLICKGCACGKKDLSVLRGTWYYDQYTEYEFDGKGNGCMCIDKTNASKISNYL